MPPGPGHSHQHGPAPAGMEKKPTIDGVKNLVAVASGKGGVGKTTVAVNLAIALKTMGAKVGLMDADVYGPNVPVMLGTDEQPRAVNEKTIIPVEAYGIKMISMGLLNPGDKPLVWRGPMASKVCDVVQTRFWAGLRLVKKRSIRSPFVGRVGNESK